MKIALRILLGYFLVLALTAWFLFNILAEQVKPGVRSTQENTLVDTAHLLAGLVAADVKAGTLQQSALVSQMRAYSERRVAVMIGGVSKQTLDYRIAITDARGMVLFDSEGKATGRDYSRWNDVYLTLQGKYGARSTRERPGDDSSTVMHVAAPIMDGARIIGVLTVAKPNASVQAFIERGQGKILRRGILLLSLALLIGLAFAYWLARSLGRLTAYITAVEAGEKAVLPKLGRHEIGVLGRALEAMRHQLEGKQYVEQLMHTLAHELKSPIAAIQASAELLQEDMAPAERAHFLGTILAQNARQRQLIDKLLALVRVEKQQRLQAPERIVVAALLALAAGDCAARLAARGLRLDRSAVEEVGAMTVRGDALLLRQALGNLLDNAIDFAPPGSSVTLAARRHGDGVELVELSVRDRGAGIPSYASARLFERFYSLPRADGSKSSGLGLPFVREVMALHGGAVTVENDPDGGVRATLSLPLESTSH